VKIGAKNGKKSVGFGANFHDLPGQPGGIF
jgi:hypothetical protein